MQSKERHKRKRNGKDGERKIQAPTSNLGREGKLDDVICRTIEPLQRGVVDEGLGLRGGEVDKERGQEDRRSETTSDVPLENGQVVLMAFVVALVHRIWKGERRRLFSSSAEVVCLLTLLS